MRGTTGESREDTGIWSILDKVPLESCKKPARTKRSSRVLTSPMPAWSHATFRKGHSPDSGELADSLLNVIQKGIHR